MTRFKILPFSAQFDRSSFDCTSEALNRYLNTQVTQDIKRRVAACFLAVCDEEILAYYTLAASSIALVDLPEALAHKLPRYPSIPAVLMGRLAVAERWQGKGIGSVLVADALMRAARAEIASYALVVEAKDEAAKAFYQHFGFIPFADAPRKLFYPLAQYRPTVS